jgi:hypothetical protein
MFGFFKKKSVQSPPKVSDRRVLDVSSRLEYVEGVPLFSAELLQSLTDEFPGDMTVEQYRNELTAATRSWLQQLNTDLMRGLLESGESNHFILLGDVPDARGRAILSFAEKVLARYRSEASGIIQFGPASKMAMLVFENEDDYYRYASVYYPEGHFALSSGMFLNKGLGHFMFPSHDDMHMLEPVIAHEMFHALVAHLPLPSWLNEGLAVNAEFRVTNRVRDHYSVDVLQRQHLTYWSDEKIQQFWSGWAFYEPESQELSYDLARRMVLGLSVDWPKMEQFIKVAHHADGGESAAQEIFGHSLAVVAQAVTQRPVVSPDPSLWPNEL